MRLRHKLHIAVLRYKKLGRGEDSLEIFIIRPIFGGGGGGGGC